MILPLNHGMYIPYIFVFCENNRSVCIIPKDHYTFFTAFFNDRWVGMAKIIFPRLNNCSARIHCVEKFI